MIDRLGALNDNENSGLLPSGGAPAYQQNWNDVDDESEDAREVRLSCEDLRQYKRDLERDRDFVRTTASNRQIETRMRDVEGTVERANQTISRGKASLQRMKHDVERYRESNAGLQTQVLWKENKFRGAVRTFREECFGYTEALRLFQRTLARRSVRQLRILDPNINNLDDLEMQAMNDPMEIRRQIQERIQHFNVSHTTTDRINYLENQNEMMRKVQRSAEEIQTLMQEMNNLVLEQGEMLDDIEDHIEETRVQVKAGATQLTTAQQHKIKARKRSVCIFMLCLIILAIVIIVYVA